MPAERIILGIDPGLRHTGWGIVRQQGVRLSFVAAGRISPSAEATMATRLLMITEGIGAVLREYPCNAAAIEETFVNKNALSALKLGQARGAAIVGLAQHGLAVAEYAANRIKQSVTGHGHADKDQIGAMIRILLPTAPAKLAADAADALAVAVTHAHHGSGSEEGMEAWR